MKKQLNKQLSLILCFLMVFSAFVPVFGASDYESHWAKDAIQSGINSGIVAGYPDGSFKPEKAVTRAEFFSLVNNAFQFTTSSAVVYTDVAANAWYAPIVAKAQAAGYISGYPDGTIKPEGNITRQEAAVVLSRLRSLTAVYQNLAFTDASAIGDWSRMAVIAVVEAKIMIGYPDGRFQPQAQIKRAEALVAINNCVNYPGISITTGTVYDKAGVFGPTTESATIEGNVVIKAAGVTLQNTIVNGDLTITKDVGEGDVTLKNVTVKGDIHVSGGGVNSIYLIDVTAGKLYVMKDNGPVRIVASGTTEIDEVIVGSDVILEEVDLTGAGFVKITVEKNAAGGIDITLINVDLDSVDIMAEGVTLNMDKNSTIGTLTLDAKAAITGTGVVTNAVINASGVTFETKPTNMTVATDVTPPVITPPKTSGGGGGGGGGSTIVSVSAITAITGTAQVGEVLTAGTLTPAAATVSYQWTISDTADGTYSNIAGATANTYMIAASDAGKYIKVVATGTGSYSGTVTSVATAAILPAVLPAVLIAVTNDGSIIEGLEAAEVLTVTLTNDTFVEANVTTGSITMTGLPTGVTVGSVAYVTPTSITITLAGNSSADYDTNVTATAHVASAALTLAGGEETNTIIFVAVVEAALVSPTAPVVDDEANTFAWTNNGVQMLATDYEYSVNSGTTWTECTANPQTGITGAYAAGAVQVRAKATLRNPASAALLSLVPFTVPPVSIAVTNDGSIIEGFEAAEVLTVTLTNDTFVEANVTTGSITMTGLPTGVTVGSVAYVTTTSITITLAGNSSEDYDLDVTATAHVASSALTLAGGEETNTIIFVALLALLAPIDGLVDDTANTFDWQDNGFQTNLTDYEYSLDSGATWTVCTGSPQTGITGAYAAGAVQVRAKETSRESASAVLVSEAPFTIN